MPSHQLDGLRSAGVPDMGQVSCGPEAPVPRVMAGSQYGGDRGKYLH
jgi:hypothetical protein